MSETLGFDPATFEEASLILSCWNEEGTIGPCLERILAVLPRIEILVIHGGSDRTLEVARDVAGDRTNVRCIRHYGDIGKGHAIKTGITMASYPVIGQFDSDMQFYPEDLPALLDPVVSGRADFVIGSRFLDTSLIDETYKFSFFRDVGNRVVNTYLSLLCGTRLTDITAGSKVWTRDAIDRIAFKDFRFVYEMEIMVRGLLAGLRLEQVPVRYSARAGGISGHGSGAAETWSLIRCGLTILWGATLIRFGLW